MGYTTSYVWQGYKQKNIRGVIMHNARSVEEQHGVKRSHSNTMIVAERTGENRVYVNDGKGGFRLAESVDEIGEKFSARLDQRALVDGKLRKIRSDSNVGALMVLQLDPEFTGECSDMTPERREEVERYHQVMIDEVVDRMGYENVIAISHHWDETHPHVHVLCTAMTKDNRVAYYQAVGEGGQRSDWKVHHDRMRQRLINAGYDATLERVGKGRKGESLTMYKQIKDLQAAAKAEIGHYVTKTVQEQERLYDEAAKESFEAVEEAIDRWYRDDLPELEREAVESAKAEWRETELPAIRTKARKEAESQASQRADEIEMAAQEKARKTLEENQARINQVNTDNRRKWEEDLELAAEEKKTAEANRAQASLELEQAKAANERASANEAAIQRKVREVIQTAEDEAALITAAAEKDRQAAADELLAAKAREEEAAQALKRVQESLDGEAKAILEEFRNDLIRDRLDERYQTVNYKMRKQFGSKAAGSSPKIQLGDSTPGYWG